MLLLFNLEEDPYAIDTDSVVEVLPMVALRRVKSAAKPLAGVFSYHGGVVPVIDLCQAIRGADCPACYSTRIILVQDDSLKSEEDATPLVGLMAQVTGALKLTAASSTADRSSSVPGLGELLVTEAGLIQMIHWRHLVSAVLSDCFDRREQLNGAAVG